jgi:hypothetical protein
MKLYVVRHEDGLDSVWCQRDNAARRFAELTARRDHPLGWWFIEERETEDEPEVTP